MSMYIVIDGLDFCGKGTQMALLRGYTNGSNFVFVREPGGTSYGEEMRRKLNDSPELTPQTLFYVMLSVRSQLRSEVVTPALFTDKHIISDRSDSSTLAYQIYGQNALELEPIFWSLYEKMEPLPNLYIFLDMPAEEVARRKKLEDMKGKERPDATLKNFDDADYEFHNRVRKGFHEFAKYLPKNRCVFVDATQTIEEVQREIRHHINILEHTMCY